VVGLAVVTLTAADNGKSIAVHEGDLVVVRLPETPTTGFRWHIIQADDIIEPEGDSFELAPDPTFGSGGVHEFRFRARARTPGRLELKHWQAWEGDKSVIDRFRLDVALAP
jgi:inhibitor of cysteine peptidase